MNQTNQFLQSSLLDKGIYIVITLFILSMISERFVTWFKLYFGKEGRWFPGFSKKTEDLRKMIKTPEEEKQLEVKVLGLNIVLSCLIALLSHADLFDIISSTSPNNSIGWQKNADFDFNTFVGCILTGFFISLGSKFWHDLLDLLLYSKNLKAKLSDERTYTAPKTIEQFDEYINMPDSKITDLALERYGDAISKIPGVVGVGSGLMKKGNSKIGCLEVHFGDGLNLEAVKSEYSIQLKSGIAINVPVNKIVTGETELHIDEFNAGCLVANESEALGWGAAGCIVKKDADSSTYILSCLHVLNGDRDLTSYTKGSKIIVSTNGNKRKVATLTEGMRTETLDVAIAQISPDYRFTNNGIGNPKNVKSITTNDAILELPVNIVGGKSEKKRKGMIYNNSMKKSFPYPDKSWELSDLLVLTQYDGENYKTLTQKGDSGSLVMDDDNNAVGIVVGGDKKFTYAMKMDKISNLLKIKLA